MAESSGGWSSASSTRTRAMNLSLARTNHVTLGSGPVSGVTVICDSLQLFCSATKMVAALQSPISPSNGTRRSRSQPCVHYSPSPL